VDFRWVLDGETTTRSPPPPFFMFTVGRLGREKWQFRAGDRRYAKYFATCPYDLEGGNA